MDDDGELRTICLGEAGAVFKPRGHNAVVQFVRIAVIVNVEKFRGEGVAAAMSLAFLRINVYSHSDSVEPIGQNQRVGTATSASSSLRQMSPVILLPPSEGKAEGGTPGTHWSVDEGPLGELAPQRKKVIAALRANGGGSQKLLGVSGAHLERAQRANSTLLKSPILPAWQRYTGVVWDHLDLASLPAAVKKSALTSLLVPSGLAGVVRAIDALPDYRLKMGARLDDLGTMSAFWRESVSAVVRAYAKKRPVLDLLTIEHRAVFADRTAFIEVNFLAKTGKAIGHDAKATKGLLARHVLVTLADGATLDDALRSFRSPTLTLKVTRL